MTKVKKNSIPKEKIAFAILCSLLVGLIFTYMYLLSATVLHVVMRTEIDQQIRLIGSDISELESQFIVAQHKVSADIASLQGYTQASKKIFIDRTPDSLVLSSNIDR